MLEEYILSGFVVIGIITVGLIGLLLLKIGIVGLTIWYENNHKNYKLRREVSGVYINLKSHMREGYLILAKSDCRFMIERIETYEKEIENANK